MNKKLRRALILLVGLVFLGSCAAVAAQLIQYHLGDQTYSEAETLVSMPDLTNLPVSSFVPDEPAGSASAGSTGAASSQEIPPEEGKPVYVDPYADALRNMDFTALRQVNDDVLGWIVIPNTRLSYPLLQGKDNDYYLNRTWKKSRNSVGAIFMEWRNSPNLSDFHTIIYGHRMNNRSMFGILHNYDDQAYWVKHPCVYITDDSGSHTYEIFAAYEADVTSDTYRLLFDDDGTKQAFLDFCLSQSVIDTGVTPTIHDQILTLSTCTGRGHETRWVVQAVQKGQVPQEETQPPQEEPPEESQGDIEAPPADAADPVPENVTPENDVSSSSETSVPGELPSQETDDDPLPDPVPTDILS